MRRLYVILIPAFASALLLNSHCKKDEVPDVLPPITQEGKNSIGFKINGEVWVPYFKCDLGSDPCGEISAGYGPPLGNPDYFSFQMTRTNGSKSSTLTITSLYPINTIGNKYDSVNISYRGENWSGNSDLWGNLSTATPGSFEITKVDQVNKIISGTFSFTLYEKNGSGRAIEITEGRFDFKMNACICRY